VKLKPRTERTKTSDQIATDLRRVIVGIPGTTITTRASGGNQQLTRALGGGNQDSRLAVEIRGEDLDESRRIGGDIVELLKDVPGIANPRSAARRAGPSSPSASIAQGGAARPDGVGRGQHDRTNISGTQAPCSGSAARSSPSSSGCAKKTATGWTRSTTCSSRRPGAGPAGQEPPGPDLPEGPTQIERKNQQRILRVNAELEAGTPLGEGVQNVQARLPEVPVSQDFQIGFGAEVEQQAQAFNQLRVLLILGVLLVYAVMASQYESLRDPFIVMFSVPVAAIGVVGAP
jgi:HAE1 family hydrophobic/amphiphilic exporter-1